MIDISQELVEKKIIEVTKEITDTLELEITLNVNSCPGLLPEVTSQVQVTIMSRLQKALNVIIPDDHYIFYDKKEKKQLDIKKAAQKLIKIAHYGK